MKLPQTLTIDGKRWKVRRGTISKTGTHWGRCYPPTRTITIAWGLTPAEQLQTLVHEVLHACYWDYDEEAIQRGEEALGNLLEALMNDE